MITFTWGTMFWIFYEKANFSENDFSQELSELVQLLELKSYMPSANLVLDKEFIQFTIDKLSGKQNMCILNLSLLELVLNQRFQFRIVNPLKSHLFSKASQIFISLERKNLLSGDIHSILQITEPLFLNLLNISEAEVYLFLLKEICTNYLQFDKFYELNEDENKCLRAILKLNTFLQGIIKGTNRKKEEEEEKKIELVLQGNVNEKYLNPLAMIINASMFKLKSSSVSQNVMLGYVSKEVEEAIRERVMCSYIMHSTWNQIQDVLFNYQTVFMKCYNKFKIILTLGNICYSNL